MHIYKISKSTWNDRDNRYLRYTNSTCYEVYAMDVVITN